MTLKVVKTAQLEQVRKMATDKGVDSPMFQTNGLDNGLIARALDAVRYDHDILVVPKITAPVGGRIHILDGIPVVQDGDWDLAINNAGPNTGKDWDVRKVEHLYLPTGTGLQSCRLLLLNNNGAGWQAALTWAKQYPQLKPTAPRHVFAIGETQPNLHKKLGMNPMYVVATTECSFEGNQRACGVWWDGAEREASLFWVSRFASSDDWFVFLCE
ncbi:MAG: hypothetical protein AAB667_00510 [Patescibacteria group bacterium]